MMAAYVGLDPAKDIEWVTVPDPARAFAEGKIDAFLGTPPDPQIMRARKLGHVILNTSIDRPWSHTICCMLAGNCGFRAPHPVATKRVLRAILKAADLCAVRSRSGARDGRWRGFASRYDYVRQRFQLDCPTTFGGNTILRTRCASMRFACRRRA